MTYTLKQVKKAFDPIVYTDDDGEEWEITWNEIGWEDYGDDAHLTIDGEKVPFEVIEADSGGEGHGEHCEIIVKVGEQYFRKIGAYFSHYGTDWDGPFEEVEAVEKMVTVWEAKK